MTYCESARKHSNFAFKNTILPGLNLNSMSFRNFDNDDNSKYRPQENDFLVQSKHLSILRDFSPNSRNNMLLTMSGAYDTGFKYSNGQLALGIKCINPNLQYILDTDLTKIPGVVFNSFDTFPVFIKRNYSPIFHFFNPLVQQLTFFTCKIHNNILIIEKHTGSKKQIIGQKLLHVKLILQD